MSAPSSESSSSSSSSSVAPSLLLISESLVRSSLTLGEAIHINAQAFIGAWEQTADVPPYASLVEPDRDQPTVTNSSLFKVAQVQDALGLKVVCVRPANQQRRLATLPAVILLNDRATGYPTALIQATHLTALRTAAGSAAATDVAARADARTLAILGAGLQAREHIKAMLWVRPGIQTVHVLNRTRARADELIAEMRAAFPAVAFHVHSLDLEQEASGARQAVASADIICTLTNNGRVPTDAESGVSKSHYALLRSEHVSPGAHINAIGSFLPHMHELSSELVARCRVVVDCASATHSGDIQTALEEGRIQVEDLLELGATLPRDKYARKLDGVGSDLPPSQRKTTTAAPTTSSTTSPSSVVWRRSDTDITLFKSVGSAAQDVATAYAVWQRCQAQQQGKVAEW